jgi:NtrC-family two-component system sensor histidine kinase KinB
MPLLALIDAVLWTVTLAVSIFLARLVYRRRDLPARLFLGMVVVLMVPQLHYTITLIVDLLSRLFPRLIGEGMVAALLALWPLHVAATVLFACLALHFFLIFPTESLLVRAWRWIPLLFYVPGLALAAMMLTHPVLGSAGYATFWRLDALGLQEATIQLLFIMLVASVALARLANLYFTQATLLVRQQLAWILWGLLIGGGIVLLTDYLPTMLGLSPPASFIPGLRQLPMLIILGAFALAMQRYQFLDVAVVINRSVVYSALIVTITLLYMAAAWVLGNLFRLLTPDTEAPAIAVLTTLLVVAIALPLRDAIQRVVDRLFWRHQANYPQLLRDYSRVLTTMVSLPHLLDTVASQLEEVFHPVGLVIALREQESGFRVVVSRGGLASQSLWQEGTYIPREHFIPTRLAVHSRPLYLPLHDSGMPEYREKWLEFEAAGAHVFAPMHMRDVLVGWVVLGPRLSDLSYTGRDLGFLAALVDQSCVALENARLYGEMQQRATELAMLSMVSSTISSSLDLEHVLEAIVESVIKVVGGAKSAIFELSEDGSELSLRMARGLSSAFVQTSRHIKVAADNRALAIASRQPFIVPDIRTEPRLVGLTEMAEQEGFRAVVDAPLVGREGPLGVLSVYFDQVHIPTNSELEALATFASQAVIAIENARLYAAVTRERDRARLLYEQTDATLARRVQELTSIEEISRQLTSTLDLQRVMDLVLERALHATQADRGVIALYEPKQSSLHMMSQEGYPPEFQRYRIEAWSLERGVTGRVARTGVAAAVPDVDRDPDFVRAVPTTRSQLSVPIIHDEGILGVITLESDRLAAFSAEHLRFVQLLAEHAALGMHNAQLFHQIAEGRDRLQVVLNSTRDAVIVLDTSGRVILANPRVPEFLGPSAEAWLGSANLFDLAQLLDSRLFHSTDLDASSVQEVFRAIEEQPDQSVDIAFSSLEGNEQRHIEGTASPVLSETGEVLGWVVVLRDVTRQWELEQFREELTSMVINNLQGPLAALIGSLETLREDGQLDPNMADALLRVALGSGRKLYSRIESLLWIRRLEDKQVPLDLKLVPLSWVVQPVVDEYGPMAASGGVKLELNLPPELPPVLVDEEVIGRVFSNLLDNALKFTPTGGRIQVGATLQNGVEVPFVECAVSDTGPGIAEDAREVIFEKFHQLEQPPRQKRGGMGMGLHYCRLAVEAHGGRIWVKSQQGEGSSFRLSLPIAGSA